MPTRSVPTSIRLKPELLEEARKALSLGDDVAASIIIRKALIEVSGADMDPVMPVGRPRKKTA